MFDSPSDCAGLGSFLAQRAAWTCEKPPAEPGAVCVLLVIAVKEL